MFDVGISEIMVIAVVALIVLGPEKLPKTARTLGHLFGRLQRYVSDVKADINRELALEDLKKLQTEVTTAATNFETSVSSAVQEVETGVHAVESDVNEAVADIDGATSDAGTSPPKPGSVGASAPTQPHLAPTTETTPADGPRQSSLPGFDRG